MPVTDTHPDYAKNLDKWMKCRDAVLGEEAVKAKGEIYLPKLTKQEQYEYDAYKMRAMFYPAAQRTVIGLSGSVMRKEPIITASEDLKALMEDLGSDGESFKQLSAESISEQLSIGRVGVLVDAPVRNENGQNVDVNPYATIYYAENITNWRKELIDGERVYTMVTLKEEQEQVDPNDRFTRKCETIYRVLVLNTIRNDLGVPERVYQQQIWKMKKEKDSQGQEKEVWYIDVTITPKTLGGKALAFIPFIVINAEDVTERVKNPPILGLVNVNLSHYRTSADLEHGRHFTALPTAWVAGFDPKTTNLQIGSSIAWVSEKSDAHAGFLEFTGQGLGHLASALKEKQELMAVLGARMLEVQKLGVEAAEAINLRQAGEHSVLGKIALTAGEGWSFVLYWVQMFKIGQRENPPEVKVEFNTDFDRTPLDPQKLQMLFTALQSQGISWDTWFWNLEKGEIVPPGTTSEQEKARIAAGGPMIQPAAPAPSSQADEPDEDEEEGEDAPPAERGTSE